MTPYYQDDFATIYHGDCLEVLPSLTDVGLVLTSPPYNLSGDGWNLGSKGKAWTALSEGYEEYPDALPRSEYVAWQHDVLKACWDTLTDDGAIFYNHKPITRGNEVLLPLDLNPGLPLRQIVTWDRGGGFCTNLTHFTPSYEWIMVMAKPAFRLVTRALLDVWKFAPESRVDHPAPYPLPLARRAIDATSASLVVDPFAGSGTTLRAAKDCGRKSIGIEISERYCEIAAKRLAQEVLDFGEVP